MNEHEKMMQDLQRLLSTQKFKSKGDLQKFLDGLMGQPIPSFPKETLTAKEQAQDLVFEAHKLPIAEGKKKIKEALKLDPDCIEAYEYSGSIQRTPHEALVYYKKGIEIGRKLFGGDYMKENKGMFYGIHETRPFMRCLHQCSFCLYAMGNTKECVKILEEMVELNPNDNQGVRDHLLLYLLELDETEKFKKYAKQFDDDGMAFAQFNRALFAFKTEGESANANKKIKEAIKCNKFVAPKLLAGKEIFDIPDMHGIGDENEAKYYVAFALDVWKKTKGAREWLRKSIKN